MSAKRTTGRAATRGPKRASTGKGRRPARRSAEGRAAKPAKGTSASAPLTPQQMVALVDRYMAAFNRGDVEAVLELYHPKGTMEDPVGYTPAKGHRAIGAVYAGGFRQGVQIRLDGQVRCAERALAFPVVARTAKATLFAVNVFDLSGDGRIASMRAYWGPHNVVGEIAVRG